MTAARFAGRVLLVTGATGMAAATAARVATEGGAVFVVSLHEAECRALCEELSAAGAEVGFAAADLRDEAATEAAFAAARERFGRLDAVFAAAGASGRRAGDGALHEVPLEGWAATFELNATPAFLAAREGLRAMLAVEGPAGRQRGSLVLMASALARHPSPGLFATHAYAAAKGAILSLTTTLAAYYAPHGIRVNAIAPALVATPMAARAAEDPATVAYATAKQPLAAGMLAAADVADAVAFLLSGDARQVTGQVLEVDGGWGITEAG